MPKKPAKPSANRGKTPGWKYTKQTRKTGPSHINYSRKTRGNGYHQQRQYGDYIAADIGQEAVGSQFRELGHKHGLALKLHHLK